MFEYKRCVCKHSMQHHDGFDWDEFMLGIMAKDLGACYVGRVHGIANKKDVRNRCGCVGYSTDEMEWEVMRLRVKNAKTI